jgi:hypothetical protein
MSAEGTVVTASESVGFADGVAEAAESVAASVADACVAVEAVDITGRPEA